MKYQKIAGESLTVDQFRLVQESLAPKYGVKLPSWASGKEFWFCPNGKRFLHVFASVANPVSQQRITTAQKGYCTVLQGASDGSGVVVLRPMDQAG